MTRTTLVAFLILLFLGLAAGCTSQPNSQPRTFSIPTETPGSQLASTTANATAPRPENYVIKDIPLCQGLTNLKAPVKFDWPDIDNILDKLAEYNWGYYSCAIPQPELLAFLRTGMPKPPYLWREVNHADYAGATVVLFYNDVNGIWIYIWTIPRPDKQTSYMFIAKGDPGVPQTWECMLSSPLTGIQASIKTTGVSSIILTRRDISTSLSGRFRPDAAFARGPL
jgi:hypothetical protein